MDELYGKSKSFIDTKILPKNYLNDLSKFKKENATCSLSQSPNKNEKQRKSIGPELTSVKVRQKINFKNAQDKNVPKIIEINLCSKSFVTMRKSVKGIKLGMD